MVTICQFNAGSSNGPSRRGEPRRIGHILMYYVYVLISKKFKKSYVGKTNNLIRRLNEHNNGMSCYTKRFLPWELVFKEEFKTEIEAIKKEKYFKSHAGRIYLKKHIFI